MVAEHLLDLRLPDSFHVTLRAPSAMAFPAVADVFLPPGMNFESHTASLHDYVQMGSVGAAARALIAQAMVIGGGCVVQSVYKWITKKWQPLLDQAGNMLDFPAARQPQLRPCTQCRCCARSFFSDNFLFSALHP